MQTTKLVKAAPGTKFVQGVAVTPKKKKAGTAVAVHQPQQPKTFLEVIRDAATNPGTDVGKMQALLDMQFQIERRNAEIAFNNALADAKQSLPVVVKDKKADRNIGYATLENVSRKLDPILKANGFTISYGMADCPSPDDYRITATLSHRAGHTREYFADIPFSTTGPGGKPIMNDTQGAGAAISYGRRYLKLMIFDIVVADEDTDGGAPPNLITEKQVKEIRKRMTASKLDDETFCVAFNIDKVENLPASKYDAAIERFDQRQKVMG